MKEKTLVPLIVFLLGICLFGFITYHTDTHEKEQKHITAQLNATTYGERIKNEITGGIEITKTLKQVLISENGEFHQFDTIAENMMSDSVLPSTKTATSAVPLSNRHKKNGSPV